MTDMFDFNEIAEKRRTVRNFDNKTNVNEEKIERIICAARSAPAKVADGYKLIVINVPDIIRSMRSVSDFGFDKDGEYVGSPLMIITCYDSDTYLRANLGRDAANIDSSIVTTFMMMEAVSIGLGTAWISDYNETELKKIMHLPDNWVPISLLYIGFEKDTTPEKEPKKDQMTDKVFYNGLNY